MADQKGLEKKYEEQLRKQTRGRQDEDEDFSDMVAEHSAKQNVRCFFFSFGGSREKLTFVVCEQRALCFIFGMILKKMVSNFRSDLPLSHSRLSCGCKALKNKNNRGLVIVLLPAATNTLATLSVVPTLEHMRRKVV